LLAWMILSMNLLNAAAQARPCKIFCGAWKWGPNRVGLQQPG
jgi:hypothetical protein